MVTKNRERVRANRRANEQSILDATEALLQERAYRDLTIEDVMATAGLTRTAFYRYFLDLESVLLRLVEDIGDELVTATGPWITADPTEARRALVDAGRNLARIYLTHGRLLAAFADAAAVSPDVDVAWRRVIDGFIADNTHRLTELRSRGLSDVERPEEAARALVWMTERYLLETYGRTSEDRAVDDVAQTLADIWHRSVFRNEPRS